MEISILTETELRTAVSVDAEAVDAIEAGFTRLASGDVTVPPIMRIDVPEYNGEVDVKSAYVRGLDSFAIKVSSGFFDNYKFGLPSLSGLMMLFATDTGIPQAMLLDNGYLTDVRTAAAGAVAARHLAPERVETAGVIGTGTQARYQIRALTLVRDIERLLVYGRTPEHVERYVDEMRDELDIEVVAAPDVETVVRESRVVVTTTPARDGYLAADWLHPGLHVTAMGSDAEHKQELATDVLARADRFVCDLQSQSARLGELHHALEAGVIDEDDDRIVELGEVTAGRQPGRESDHEITVCDLTGVGVQDTVIARLAYRKAREQGYGTTIEN